MALNAFMKIGNATGEARQGIYGKEKWIELQSWEWDVEAETSWTKGGGASVGKPNPGKMTWDHNWDKSSSILLGYICTGSAFAEIKLHMCKTTGAAEPKPFFTILMKEAFITKCTQSATEDGNVLQKVEMVFKYIEIEYSQQGSDPNKPGMLIPAGKFDWDIPGGVAHPAGP